MWKLTLKATTGLFSWIQVLLSYIIIVFRSRPQKQLVYQNLGATLLKAYLSPLKTKQTLKPRIKQFMSVTQGSSQCWVGICFCAGYTLGIRLGICIYAHQVLLFQKPGPLPNPHFLKVNTHPTDDLKNLNIHNGPYWGRIRM